MSKKLERNIPKVLAVGASIATLAVPILYIIGFGYDQGYLGEYGVSTDFFPRSIQEYLVFSFYSFLFLAISIFEFSNYHWKAIFTFSTLIATMALLVVFLSRINIELKLKNAAKALKAQKSFDYIFFPIISWVISVVIPYIIIISLALLLFVPIFGYYKGRNSARNEIAKMKPCSTQLLENDRCVELIENGKVLIRGHFVARSNTHIAIYEDGKTSIFPLRESVVVVKSLRHEPSPTIKRDAPKAVRPSP